jgi:hypothetical protein
MMSVDKPIGRDDLDINDERPLDSPSQTNSKETVAEPGIQNSIEHNTTTNAGDVFSPNNIEQELYIVEFEDANDPAHPLNWSLTVR